VPFRVSTDLPLLTVRISASVQGLDAAVLHGSGERAH
jgi:hypothetical protein